MDKANMNKNMEAKKKLKGFKEKKQKEEQRILLIDLKKINHVAYVNMMNIQRFYISII